MAEAGASSPGINCQQLMPKRCHQLLIYFCIPSNGNRPEVKVMPRHGGLEHRSTSLVPQVRVKTGGAAYSKMPAPNGQRSDLWLKRRCPQARRSSHATVGQIASPEPPPRGSGQSMARTGRPTVLQARPLPQAALHCPRSAARRACTLTHPALPPVRALAAFALAPTPPRGRSTPAPAWGLCKARKHTARAHSGARWLCSAPLSRPSGRRRRGRRRHTTAAAAAGGAAAGAAGAAGAAAAAVAAAAAAAAAALVAAVPSHNNSSNTRGRGGGAGSGGGGGGGRPAGRRSGNGGSNSGGSSSITTTSSPGGRAAGRPAAGRCSSGQAQQHHPTTRRAAAAVAAPAAAAAAAAEAAAAAAVAAVAPSTCLWVLLSAIHLREFDLRATSCFHLPCAVLPTVPFSSGGGVEQHRSGLQR